MAFHTLPYPMDEAQFFAALAYGRRDPVWLDGSAPGSRYSILAADPRERLAAAGEDAIARLRDALRPAPPPGGPPPFAGGAIGVFSYDLGRHLVGLPPRPGSAPEMLVGLYDWAVVIDHRERQCRLVGPAADRALAVELGPLTEAAGHATAACIQGPLLAEPGAGDYTRAFQRVRHYLREGDCYQVNLARCFSIAFEGDPLAAYRLLRGTSPAPFAAYLGFAEQADLCISPERFLRLRGTRVETRPIKGTRARESEASADAADAPGLLACAKDRAENVMIADLLRNDLGQVCRIGSVQVPQLCALESHPTVHHLVSTVTGELAPGRDALDLLAATLPGGSITGAPKRRAMQIIDELEATPRGVYCGAIGYLGYDGAMDTSIAIRTATVRDGRIEYRAGGGLVWDSVSADEFAETEAKAAAFRRLIDALREC